VLEHLAFSEGLLELENAGLIAFDSDCRIIFFSRVMQEMWAMAACDVVGRAASKVLPFLERSGADVQLRSAIAGRTAVACAVHCGVADGRPNDGYFDGHFAPLIAEDDEIIGCIGVIHDVTEQKLAEERLRETERYIGSSIDITDRKRIEAELLQAVRDRDDFLSIASHELRTPLTTLQLEVEGLARSAAKTTDGAPPGDRLLRSVDAIAVQTARLIRLVEELLDMSRLAGGQVRLQPTSVDLGALVKDIVLRFKSSLDTAQCSVELDIEDRVVGAWDRLRIEQVASNLLSNAIKYGAGKPICIAVGRSGTDAVLAMRDLGIGVAPEHQTRIFRRFERAVSTENYGGFGLGLWISREITHAHGGSIHVDSSLGKGATFTVKLPLAQRHLERDDAVARLPGT
jgi:signal transduction histidine kinase